MSVCAPYNFSTDNYYKAGAFKNGGTLYDGFTMQCGQYPPQYVLINLKGKFSNLEFDFGHVDESNNYDCTLNIYLDEKLSQSIEQKADSLASHHSIPLDYAKGLKLEFVGYSQYGLGNIKLQY